MKLEKITNSELRAKQAGLLSNMKGLRHGVNDLMGSDMFVKKFEDGVQNAVLTVDGKEYPVYVTKNTICADGSIEITDDIFDEENYLALTSDDEILWLALIQKLNKELEMAKQELDKVNREKEQLIDHIQKLKVQVHSTYGAEPYKNESNNTDGLLEVISRNKYLEEINNGLTEALREANKKCTEYVHQIDKDDDLIIKLGEKLEKKNNENDKYKELFRRIMEVINEE